MTTPAPPARVVVRMPNWLGDVVMALPALAAVRAHYPPARLAVAVRPPLAPLFEAVKGVDDVLVLPGGIRADAAALKQGQFDAAILFTNSFGSALAVRRAGIAERWGYRRDFRGFLLTRAVSTRSDVPPRGSHHSFYYQRLVAALGMENGEGKRLLEPPAAWLERADALLDDARIDRGRPLIGFAPGAAYGQAKRWPPRHVADVAARTIDELAGAVVLIGAAGDRETGHAIESAAGDRLAARGRGGRFANLIGRTTIAGLVGLAARCGVVVSNDSGAMHVAAAVGTPTIALFGPTDANATAPIGPHVILTRDVFCRPCHLRECPIDHRCMTRILPGDVLEHVVRVLGEDQ